MQCAHIRSMLLNYALDDARRTERLCVDVHIAHCPACQRELEDLCELILTCDHALAHPAPRDNFDAVMARIKSDEVRQCVTQVRGSLQWKAVRVGAVAALAAALIGTVPLVWQAERVVDGHRDKTQLHPGVALGSIHVPEVVTEQLKIRRQAETHNNHPDMGIHPEIPKPTLR